LQAVQIHSANGVKLRTSGWKLIPTNIYVNLSFAEYFVTLFQHPDQTALGDMRDE
jgi:hypothetical protein